MVLNETPLRKEQPMKGSTKFVMLICAVPLFILLMTIVTVVNVFATRLTY